MTGSNSISTPVMLRFGSMIALILISMATIVESRSSHYYDLLEAIQTGQNYYTILGVEQDAEPSEIKRAYRQLALKLHPDKNPGDEEAYKLYRKVMQANEYLSDPQIRKEYDDLLANGIPLHEQYWGQYAHAYGAPDHDIRWVLFWLVTAITAFKYFYGWYYYYWLRDAVFKTSLYRQRLKRVLQESNIEIPKVKKRANAANSEDDFNDKDWLTEDLARQALGEDLGIGGLRKPKLRDLFIFDILRFPYKLYHTIYDCTRTLSPEEQDLRLRRKLNMEEKSDADWAAYKQHQQRMQQQMMNSNKAKIARRWMKNRTNVPTNFNDE